MKEINRKTKYFAIYTDEDFPLDASNIFKSSSTYDGRKDWYNNSTMDSCIPLAFISVELPNSVGICQEVIEEILKTVKDNKTR